MIEQEFDLGGITATNLCAALKPPAAGPFQIPTDASVKTKLEEMLNHTVAALNSVPTGWEEFDVSEDYGAARKIYVPKATPYLQKISALHASGHPHPIPQFADLASLDFYFAEFWDGQQRKLVAVRRAVRLKATLKATGSFLVWRGNQLSVVDDPVLHLDREFDALIGPQNVYVWNVRNFELIADIVQMVAATAKDKLHNIEAALPFLDLSAIAADIEKHPRKARVAAAIAQRGNLDIIDPAKVRALAAETDVELRETNGKVKPLRRSEYGLLQLLDYRRYQVDITSDAPQAFEAMSRRRLD